MSETGKYIDPQIEMRIRELVEAGLEKAAAERDCASRHERSSNLAMEGVKLGRRANDRLIVVSGEDGKNGRLGRLEIKVARHDDRLTAVEKAVWKLLVAAAGGAGLAKAVEMAVRAAAGG